MPAGHHSPLEHAMDHPTIDLPWGDVIHLPNIFGLQITRLMLMELIAAGLILAIFIPLARHTSANRVTRGAFRNAFEAVVLYVRDKIARPSIGGHGADQFVPYLLTAFLFILFSNLLGMIPGGGAPTGNLNVTAVLAISTFCVVLFAGIRESGPVGFWIKLVPSMDLPIFLKVFLWPLLFLIEIVGLLIRHGVLAVRLFANMLAGHVVVGAILGFILLVQGTHLIWVIAPASVLGVVLLSLLDLLVAFLQAYIFTLLSALFIGSAVHPH